jgi:hypothetical protein
MKFNWAQAIEMTLFAGGAVCILAVCACVIALIAIFAVSLWRS